MMIVIHIITIIVIRIGAIMCCICASIICFRLAFKSASFGGSFLAFRTISVIDISTLALCHDVSVKRIWGSVEARVI